MGLAAGVGDKLAGDVSQFQFLAGLQVRVLGVGKGGGPVVALGEIQREAAREVHAAGEVDGVETSVGRQLFLAERISVILGLADRFLGRGVLVLEIGAVTESGALLSDDDEAVVAAGYREGDEGRDIGELETVIDQISLREQDVADSESDELVGEPVFFFHGFGRPDGVQGIRIREVLEQVAFQVHAGRLAVGGDLVCL